jgi:hypothetical protein
MKTSNKILITIGILATGWILFRSVVLSIGVPQIANGKPSPFINLPGETNKIDIGRFTDLSIESKGNTRISIKQGPKAGITGDKNMEDCLKIKYQGSALLIMYENKSSSVGYINITTPSLNSIRINNPDKDDCSNTLKIEGFNADSLAVTSTRFQYLTISDCILSKLNLTTRNAAIQYAYLTLKESNQIQNLNLDIQGEGWMYLQTAGLKTNNFIVSDSMGIGTSAEVLKLLNR